jgi:hypothetical protein
MFSLALQDCLSAEVAEPSVVEKERESLVSIGVWRWLKKVSMGCNWLMQLIKVSLRTRIYHGVRSKFDLCHFIPWKSVRVKPLCIHGYLSPPSTASSETCFWGKWRIHPIGKFLGLEIETSINHNAGNRMYWQRTVCSTRQHPYPFIRKCWLIPSVLEVSISPGVEGHIHFITIIQLIADKLLDVSRIGKWKHLCTSPVC